MASCVKSGRTTHSGHRSHARICRAWCGPGEASVRRGRFGLASLCLGVEEPGYGGGQFAGVGERQVVARPLDGDALGCREEG